MKQNEEKDQKWLQSLMKKSNNGKNRRLPLHYLVLLGCLGVALMIMGNLLSDQNETDQSLPVYNESEDVDEVEEAFKRDRSAEPNSMEDYEMRYENQLKELLEQMIGLSDVSVMVNLAETERSVYERDSVTKEQLTDETDREGGKRTVDDRTREEQVVIIREGDKEVPILIHKEKPEVRGVLVVAQGVENANSKSQVIEAVSRVLDVPSHRISVMPKKTKEGS
ncbi:stage III sporulation protein AG [Halalkalibacter hemicellulosilyticus]|uniref:Stage III sporulation protein AG n=1 Tax=Halalkalibacter hemicellulosilyticusJCM 9152 TaxID=1236971 RepID=W4QIY4_9BACI|nr:stage III sporulation protein AG [Halalkalibacter hemicellulosilyticus]GAE31872.1 stage III sporulation protein AG [Halalkalibacter hemicellulosilyticusJCM 9152]